MKREHRSCKEKDRVWVIRGPVLPPSHYSSNNTASGLSDPPPEPTSKPRNHPGVQRMPLQSCISSPSLLVINESVSDSFRMSPIFSFFPSHTLHPTAKFTRLSQRGPVYRCFRLVVTAAVGLTKGGGGPSESRLRGEDYWGPTVKLLIDWLLKWTGIIRSKVTVVFFTTINLLYKSCQWTLLKM